MKTYRISLAWRLFGLTLVVIFGAGAFVIQEPLGLVIAGLICSGAFYEWSTRIAIDGQGISTSVVFFPCFPPWRRFALWSNIVEVRPFFNPTFVEGDALLVKAHARQGKYTYLLIPIAMLGKRRDFLHQLSTSLPAHAQLALPVMAWAQTVGLTPRWQLGIALGIIAILAVIAWAVSK